MGPFTFIGKLLGMLGECVEEGDDAIKHIRNLNKLDRAIETKERKADIAQRIKKLNPDEVKATDNLLAAFMHEEPVEPAKK